MRLHIQARAGTSALMARFKKVLEVRGLGKGGRPPMPTALDEKFFLKIASTLLEYNEFKRINQLLFQLKSMILGGIKVD